MLAGLQGQILRLVKLATAQAVHQLAAAMDWNHWVVEEADENILVAEGGKADHTEGVEAAQAYHVEEAGSGHEGEVDTGADAEELGRWVGGKGAEALVQALWTKLAAAAAPEEQRWNPTCLPEAPQRHPAV